jgi:two-component SAPR family response regulator
LRILIAEDESLIALDLVGMVENFGCDVAGPVSRIDEVLREIDSGRIDGALLDVNLRGQQIFDVLAEVLERGVKVILTSGYDDVTLFPLQFRALPRVAKPFTERALRQACETVFLD